MAGQVDYSSQDVTMALMALAENAGDVDRTADQLIDDRFMVPADTLRLWKLEVHSEQYRRLERQLGDASEAETIAHLRARVRSINGPIEDLVEKVKEIEDPRLMPQALRALVDAQAKGTNALLQLTGRPVNGDRSSADTAGLLKSMVESGIIRLAPGVELDGPQKVDNLAEGTAEAA